MIPKTSKVLVTTDLSDFANRAIPYAYVVTDPDGVACPARASGRG